jgi:predicted unusual protein kinase regulating ubiquinone biosynthesis (AarF/ABC1/UbiB family)
LATPFKSRSRLHCRGNVWRLIWSLIKDGLDVDDWDTFWSRRQTTTTPTNAERVAAAIERLGPTYVKFGQALSARPDVIPAPLANALSVLQDQMQVFDSSTAYDILRTEITQTGALKGAELDVFIESLSSEPVAAASIGQVYKRGLVGRGEVQRPGIRDVVHRTYHVAVHWLVSLCPVFPENRKNSLQPS